IATQPRRRTAPRSNKAARIRRWSSRIWRSRSCWGRAARPRRPGGCSSKRVRSCRTHRLSTERSGIWPPARGATPKRSSSTTRPASNRAAGELASGEGRNAEAIEQYEQAVELDAEDAASHSRLGVAERRNRDFERAGKQFDKVASLDPEYPGLALERGLLFEA